MFRSAIQPLIAAAQAFLTIINREISMKVLKIIFFSLLLGSLSFSLVLAADSGVGLEVNYPTFGNTNVSTTSIPATVKYIFNGAMILALLAVIGSLVYGGVLYLTAAGDPSGHAKGKKQLLGSFLGLVILLGAYITLQFVNPELLSLSVSKTPVKSGILLLNYEAWNKACSDPSGPKYIEGNLSDMLEETDQDKPQVVPLLAGGIANTEEAFGKLKNGKFEKFTPIGIYVFPNNYCQIYSYQDVNFQKVLNYSYVYPYSAMYYDFVKHKDRARDDGNDNDIDIPGLGIEKNCFLIPNPSQVKSIQAVVGYPVGVQLATVDENHVTDQKYLFTAGMQLDLTDIPSPGVQSIAIRNWAPVKDTTGVKLDNQSHDYIAILYEKAMGYNMITPSNFRIFLEYREHPIAGFSGLPPEGNLPPTKAVFKEDKNNSFFNIFTKPPIYDAYGALKDKVGAIRVDELDPNGKVEVYLCNEANIMFPAVEDSPHCFPFDDPIFTPRDFKSAELVLALDGKDLNNNGKCDSSAGSSGEKCVTLTNNVWSLFIKGKALVVLFAKSVDDLKTGNLSGFENSEVFFSGGTLYKSNLTNDNGITHKIMACGKLVGSTSNSCAKGIAIYPIK